MRTPESHEAELRIALSRHGIDLDDGMDGRAWSIEVYCQEASHAEKRWDIGKFFLRVHPGYPVPLWEWQPRRKRHRKGRAAARREERRAGTEVFHPGPQHLVGNQLLPEAHNKGDLDEVRGQIESRYPIKCNACDLSLPWRQRKSHGRSEDALQVELDRRAIARVSKVSLSELVARLTKPI